jgi:proteasome component ECM29
LDNYLSLFPFYSTTIIAQQRLIDITPHLEFQAVTMTSASSQDEVEREYTLISKLEFRIATAPTDDKLEELLQKYLAALLLKLASPIERNRNLTIKICQYVNSRLKINTLIKVPISALVKTFRENANALIRHFCLVFIELGLPRIEPNSAIEILPSILQFATPANPDVIGSERKMWAIVFDFLLQVLKTWKIPDKSNKEDLALRDTFALASEQTSVLSSQLADFALWDPSNASIVDEDFRPVMEKNYKRRSEILPRVAKLLLTSIFNDEQRLIPATILSVDSNDSVASLADAMFKQCEFNLESDATVDGLFSLYKRSKPKHQTRILTLLSRSQTSSSRTVEIMSMVERQLTSSLSSGLEAAKLRAALFSYLTWSVRVGGQHLAGETGQRIQTVLKDYIEMQGWPSMNQDYQTQAEIELRAKAYESIGMLAALKDRNVDERRLLDLTNWLFTSLRCDMAPDVRTSIEESIGRLMNSMQLDEDTDSDLTMELKKLLLWNVNAKTGDEDPTYYHATVRDATYSAVRFANKCLPFEDVDARAIDILALTTSGEAPQREVAEEALRGLDPYWHHVNNRLSSAYARLDQLRHPGFDAMVRRMFDKPSSKALKAFALSNAIVFCRNVLVYEALSNSKLLPSAEMMDWKTTFDALINNDEAARKCLREYMESSSKQESLLVFMQATLDGVGIGSVQCLDIALEVLSLATPSLLFSVKSHVFGATEAAIGNIALQLRAARIFGIVASVDGDAEALFQTELAKSRRWETAVGEELVKVQGHLLRACYCETRTVMRGRQTGFEEGAIGMAAMTVHIILQTHDRALRETAYRCLRQIALCPPGAIDVEDEALLEQIFADARKENENAVSVIGPLLGLVHSRRTSRDFEKLLEKTIHLHEVKKAEFHFALGETLAVAAASFTSTSTMTEVDVAIGGGVGVGNVNDELLNTVLERTIKESMSTKPSMRKAAAIWLLCLVQYCGTTSAVKMRLKDSQTAFARLLNDRDEIVQETGSRGLGLGKSLSPPSNRIKIGRAGTGVSMRVGFPALCND